MKCPNCGRFCKDIYFTENLDHEIKSVTGTCSKCGIVDLINADWDWDSLHGPTEECAEDDWVIGGMI